MQSGTYAARVAILLALSAAFMAGVFLLPPCAQPTGYHDFADTRTIFGIANFFNVITNLLFLLVGIAGLAFLLRDPRAPSAFFERAEQRSYAVFFIGVALTGIGSAYYHLAPDNARLVWDRLPMTIGFMSMSAAMISERVSLKGGMRLLGPLVVLGIASVGYWRLSASAGAENVMPYVVVQYGSIAIVLLIAALFPSRYTQANRIYLVIGLYIMAKIAENLDAWVFSMGSIVSGHSIKHLVAACAAYQILRMLKARARDKVALSKGGQL